MTATGRNYPRLGIWGRLMVTVGGLVVVIWVMLAVSILFFARTQQDLKDLASSQVPRIALVGELAEYSAQLARISTSILGRQASDKPLIAELELVSSGFTAALASPLFPVQKTSDSPASAERVRLDLLELLAIFERRQAESQRLAEHVEALRWLNIDIQDEVDPILNDYAFNIAVLMRNMEDSDSRNVRADLVARISRERALRDHIVQIGTDAGTVVTLALQGSVAADTAQLQPLAGLSEDMQVRLSQAILSVPDNPEFLTLRQSIDQLGAQSVGSDGIFSLRRTWLVHQSDLYTSIQSLQDEITSLQSMLSEAGRMERQQVLETIAASSARAQSMKGWLIAMTVAVGFAGVTMLFGIIRRGIILPLQQMTGEMMMIAEGQNTGEMSAGSGDEIGRMRRAVTAFQSSVAARDAAIDALKQTHADLVQAGKMAALGNLSAGISHELNQPLAAIKYRLHLLASARQQGNSDNIDRQISLITGLTDRMEATIAHLRRFARRSDFKREQLLLGETLDNAVALMRGKIDVPGITLHIDPACCSVGVVGDAVLVEQVLVNLLSNSVDAIIEARHDGVIEVHGRQNQDRYAIMVDDNGVGLGGLQPQEVIEPFVTSKETGRGMGLGLSISYSIAIGMRGDLRLERRESGGTRAIFELPTGGNGV